VIGEVALGGRHRAPAVVDSTGDAEDACMVLTATLCEEDRVSVG
jgi:hypothetical protein